MGKEIHFSLLKVELINTQQNGNFKPTVTLTVTTVTVGSSLNVIAHSDAQGEK